MEPKRLPPVERGTAVPADPLLDDRLTRIEEGLRGPPTARLEGRAPWQFDAARGTARRRQRAVFRTLDDRSRPLAVMAVDRDGRVLLRPPAVRRTAAEPGRDYQTATAGFDASLDAATAAVTAGEIRFLRSLAAAFGFSADPEGDD